MSKDPLIMHIIDLNFIILYVTVLWDFHKGYEVSDFINQAIQVALLINFYHYHDIIAVFDFIFQINEFYSIIIFINLWFSFCIILIALPLLKIIS